jgi:hypothetical protein
MTSTFGAISREGDWEAPFYTIHRLAGVQSLLNTRARRRKLRTVMNQRTSSSQIPLHAPRIDATEGSRVCGWTYPDPPDPLEPSLRIAFATARWLETLEDPTASAEQLATAKAWVDEETRRAFEDAARAQAMLAMQAGLEMLRRRTQRSRLRPGYRLPVRRSATRAPRRARRARHTTQAVARGSPPDDGPEPPIRSSANRSADASASVASSGAGR